MSRLLIVDRSNVNVTEHRLGARTLIGRSSSCDLVLDNMTVSRRHAFIERTDLGYLIEDMESASGVYVNDTRINGPYLLKPNDRINIGQVDIVFHSETDKPNQALKNARQRFGQLQLPLPPIPDAFVSDLEEYGDWFWGTRKIESLYQGVFPLIRELIKSAVPDYLIFGHAGHGINSYAIHYFLVYERLALFMEIGFGGVYMDPGRAAADVRHALGAARALLDVTPQLAGRIGAAQRLLVQVSTFRPSFWHALGPGPSPAGIPRPEDVEAIIQAPDAPSWREVLEDALRWARY